MPPTSRDARNLALDVNHDARAFADRQRAAAMVLRLIPEMWASPCDSSKTWPPFTSIGAPHAGPGVKQSLLAVTKRTDGGLQVTYKRHPLYYFHGFKGAAGDKKPGDTNGQGFVLSWFVLAPAGTPIRS